MKIEVIGKSFSIERILINGEELKNSQFIRVNGELFKKYIYKSEIFLLADGTKIIKSLEDWKKYYKEELLKSKHTNEIERNKAMLSSLERGEF